MARFRLQEFIAEFVTGRRQSLLAADLKTHRAQLQEQIESRAVLVIGGAGTIGASFVKAILEFGPRSLYIVDTNENGLTEITRDLRSSPGLTIPREYVTYPVDFGSNTFRKIFVSRGPFDIVANFAAHKHVRSEKDHFSIEAMIENNILKAKKLLDLLSAKTPEHFFCVSTDKAANPVNVMGASKKLMEETILAFAEEIPVTTARFANVAFSNGSLLHGFMERMAKAQPLSAPTDVRRYFVSPEESGQLCLIACVLGESGEIFFPKLDPQEMKSFSDIAVEFLREYGGYQPYLCDSEDEARTMASGLSGEDRAYPVYFFESDTSGEKPFEEFYTGSELLDKDRFFALGVIKSVSSRSRAEIDRLISGLTEFFDEPIASKDDVVQKLSTLLPAFNHLETGKSLDQRM